MTTTMNELASTRGGPSAPSGSAGHSSAAVSTTARREEKKAQSRRRIIDAARDVFFRDGFMSANLDEVAERAGVAKGTLYRYFDSKADLYVAVLADKGNAFTEKMSERANDTSLSAIGQLVRISNFYLDYWNRHPEYFQIFWAIDNQPVIGDLPEPVIVEVSRLWEQSLAILADVIRRATEEGDLEACDPWEVANILWTSANAIIQSDATRARRDLRGQSLERSFRRSIFLTLRGLAAPDSRLRATGHDMLPEDESVFA